MRVIIGNRFDLHGFYIRIRRGAIRVQGRNRFVSHRFRNYLLEFFCARKPIIFRELAKYFGYVSLLAS